MPTGQTDGQTPALQGVALTGRNSQLYSTIGSKQEKNKYNKYRGKKKRKK